MIKELWAGFKKAAHVVGDFQATVLLSLFYFLIVPPFALLVKLSLDPMRLKPQPPGSLWLARRQNRSSLENSRLQS